MKNITKTSQLFTYFSIDREYFNFVKGYPQIDTLFKEINIPKKRGGIRKVISVQDVMYVGLLRRIRDYLISISTFPDYVQGFIKTRSIFTNASCHLNKKIVINADIRDFFSSIAINKVFALFLEIGFNEEVSNLLTEIVTLKGKIPPGFHTSPILANLIFQDVDIELDALARLHGYRYTRYADDMTFSGDNPDYVISQDDLNKILQPHGFIIHDRKYKIQYKGNKQYVTGLTVSEKDKPRMPRRIKRNIRLELHYIKKYGIEGVRKNVFFNEENFHTKMEGWFGYAIGVKEYGFVSLLNRYISDINDNEFRSKIEKVKLDKDGTQKTLTIIKF